MSGTYSESLKHPDWQRKRLEIFQRDNWRCKLCDNKDKQLCVHHLCYAERGTWRGVPDKFLITVCNECHSEIGGFRIPQARRAEAPRIAEPISWSPKPVETMNESQTLARLAVVFDAAAKTIPERGIYKHGIIEKLCSRVSQIPIVLSTPAGQPETRTYRTANYDTVKLFVESEIAKGHIVATAYNKKGDPYLFRIEEAACTIN